LIENFDISAEAFQMRQYSLKRWIIDPTLLAAAWLACAMGPGTAAAVSAALTFTDAPTSGALDNADAFQAWAQRQSPSPVTIGPLTLHGATASAEVRVAAWAKNSLVEAVLAIPDRELTGASISLASTTETTKMRGDEGPLPVTVNVRPMGYIRGNRLAKIQFSAAMPDRSLMGQTSAVLSLQFAADVSGVAGQRGRTGSDAAQATGGVVDQVLARLVDNPQDLARFQVPLQIVPIPPSDGAPPLGDGTAGAVARFVSDKAGFMAITGEDLADAGVATTQTRPQSISIWTDGRQVPVWALAEDGTIESDVSEATSISPADRFVIFAQDNSSTYTTQRTYWVRTDAPATPMQQRSLTMQTPPQPDAFFMAHQLLEKDLPPVLTKNDQFLSILDYRWVWWTWTARTQDSEVPDPHSYSEPGQVSFDLPRLVERSDASSSLTLEFYTHHWGAESPEVPFEVSLNGKSVGEAVITNVTSSRFDFSVAPGVLRPSGNQLEIMPIVTTTDTARLADICFDRAEVNYPRDYQVTSATLEFTAPASGAKVVTMDLPAASFVADITANDPIICAVQSTSGSATIATTPGHKYLVVTSAALRRAQPQPVKKTDDLRSTSNQGDLVVIAWPEFINHLSPWVKLKESQGHTVRIVNVLDIYDQFGYGHLSPHAIREFLRYAATRWQSSPAGPPVSAVLLVGDSTSAYRNEFRNDVVNYVPTVRLRVNGDAFASDQWYVTMFGNDLYADALIGRFSVNSVEDLDAVIAKQVDYATKSAAGAWQNTLGFIADHSEFEDAVDRVMKHVAPPRYFLNRVLMSELPWVDNFYFPKDIADAQQAKVSPEATLRIRNMFNDGAAVVTYFGHGSPNVWSSERMWFGGDSPNSDNLLLTNRDKLSIVINMTCNSGAIDYPQRRWNVCISEDFMRVTGGGAVACVVPSGPGLTVQHERLMTELGRCLFAADESTLGQDVQLGLWRYLAAQNPPELARMYILLGDPLLHPLLSRPLPVQSGAVPSRQSQAAIAGTGTATELAVIPDTISRLNQPGHAQLVSYENGQMLPGKISPIEPGARIVPLPEDYTTASAALAVSAHDQSEAKPDAAVARSTFTPLHPLSALNLVQWHRTDAPADDDGTADLQLRVKNDSPQPLQSVHLELKREDCSTCPAVISSTVDIPPLGDGLLAAAVPLSPGLNRYQVTAVQSDRRLHLQPDQPVVVAGLRPDSTTSAPEIVPAAVDPQSVLVRYRETGQEIHATISARVYVFAREPLSNLSIGLAGPDSVIRPDSVVPVPSGGPGSASPISMAVLLPKDAEERQFSIQLDPSGYYPELHRQPPLSVRLGHAEFPDIVVADVTSPETSPSDGETIFFDVKLQNRGATTVDGVQVEGWYLSDTGAEQKMQNQVKLRPAPISLKPGESRTVRLRWDPFHNAGVNYVRIEANSQYKSPDRDPANNSVKFDVKVRTKARLQKGPVRVLPLTDEDRKTRRVRLAADIHNAGESDAHGLRVMFYASPDLKELLGEVDLDSVPAGKSAEAVISYPLKAGEENRKFRFTYELMYKGARQRLPAEAVMAGSSKP